MVDTGHLVAFHESLVSARMVGGLNDSAGVKVSAV